jgi:hypothetical protein
MVEAVTEVSRCSTPAHSTSQLSPEDRDDALQRRTQRCRPLPQRIDLGQGIARMRDERLRDHVGGVAPGRRSPRTDAVPLLSCLALSGLAQEAF